VGYEPAPGAAPGAPNGYAPYDPAYGQAVNGYGGAVNGHAGVNGHAVNGHAGTNGHGVNGHGVNGQAAVNGYATVIGSGVNGQAVNGQAVNGYDVANGQATVNGTVNARGGVDAQQWYESSQGPAVLDDYRAREDVDGVPGTRPDVREATPDWLGASVPPRRSERRGHAESRTDSRTGGRSGSRSSSRADGRIDPGERERPDGDTALPSRRLRRPRKKSRTALGSALGAVAEIAIVLTMALALSLVIKTFLVQAFFIPSQSMQDTLLIGDRVLVSKLTPGPFDVHRGDVVVFKDPGGWLPPRVVPEAGPVRKVVTDVLTFVGLLPQDSGEHLIKRVIGLPGDTVVCCDAAGKLKVNGVSITEPYLRPGNVPSTSPFEVKVREGQLWVMGDNRSESADSRMHRDINDGQVPLADVVGKAFVIVWPFGRFQGVSDPPDVFAGVPTKAPEP
jgi:signal peptidase I